MRINGEWAVDIENLKCWQCEASLKGLPLPLGRREECASCGSSLHVCRMCEFYDPTVSKDCREPMADEVSDKENANFCDYFRPHPGLTAQADPAAADARAKLAALFGEEGKATASRPGDVKHPPNKADKTREKLNALFEEEKK